MTPAFIGMLAATACWAIAGAGHFGGVPAAWAQAGRASEASAPAPSVRLEANPIDCPSAEQLKAMLAHAGISVAATAEWVLSYGNASPGTLEAGAPFVWMDLTRATGELVARRQFPRDGGDCGAIATAMSVVVERSLHELGWTRGEPLPSGGQSATPQAAPAAAAPSPRPPRPLLVVGLGPIAGTSAQMGVNLVLEARLRVAGPLSFRLGGGLLAKDDDQAVGNGRAQVSSRHLAMAILSTFGTGRARLDAGAVLVGSLDRGTTEGLAENRSGYRAALAAGPVLGIGTALSPRWRLAFELQGLRALASGDFVVTLDDGGRTVLPPPTWQGIACAKLEFAPWP